MVGKNTGRLFTVILGISPHNEGLMKGKTQKVPAWEKNLTMESAGFAYARGSFFTQN